MSNVADEKTAGVYRRRRLAGGLVIVALAAAGVATLAMLPARQRDKSRTVRTVLPVKVMPIRPEARFVDDFVLPGIVEPDVTVTVSAEVAGRVENIACTEGRPCKRGEVMVILNQDLLGAEFRRTEAQLALAKYDLDSVARLHARNAATDFALKQAKARMAAAEAVTAGARAKLDRTRIAAPIDGILNRLLVERGQYVTPGAPVAEIVDMRKVRIVVDVPERDIGYLKLSDSATVMLDMPDGGREQEKGGETLAGRIDYISEVADAASRTTRVEILVDNASGGLRGGRIVRVRLRRRILKNTIMIPLAAVIPLEKLWAVYIVEDGLARRRIVNLGFFKGRRVQVLPPPAAGMQGLLAGDMLIVEGQRFVAPGQKVKATVEQ